MPASNRRCYYGRAAALVRTSLQHYRRAQFHPVNWRPNLIIFGGSLARRTPLADLGSALVQDRGIVSVAQAYGVGNFESNTLMLGWSRKPNRRKRLRQIQSVDLI